MKRIHIIGIIIIAVAIGAIIGTVSDSSTYAGFAMAESREGKEFHVVGKADKSKEMVYRPEENANLFTFYMTDNEGLERKVLFNGSKPNDFDRSEQIVLVGKSAGQEFHASSILMKCPSKYTNTSEGIKEFKSASTDH